MRICSGVGCLRAVPDDVRYCDECRPQAVQIDIREHGTGYTAELDRLRKSTRWQRLRELVLRSQPICKRCGKRRADICDHVIPAQIAVAQVQASGLYLDRWAGYFIRSNLQGLCRLCHAMKTIEDKAHTGDWPDVLARKPKQSFSF